MQICLRKKYVGFFYVDESNKSAATEWWKQTSDWDVAKGFCQRFYIRAENNQIWVRACICWVNNSEYYKRYYEIGLSTWSFYMNIYLIFHLIYRKYVTLWYVLLSGNKSLVIWPSPIRLYILHPTLVAQCRSLALEHIIFSFTVQYITFWQF